MIRRPVAVDPVKVTMSTIGFDVSSSPTSPCPVITLSTPGGIPASAAASAIIIASSGVHGCGFSTTVHPTARAGATFTTFNMNGKLNGVMAATTPIGSRTMALPPIPVGPPVGMPFSTHGNACSTSAAFDRSMPIDPAPCTASVKNPVDPVSAMIRSRRSPARASRISAIATNLAARSDGFMYGHGPSSNARRAASIARTAVFVDASGTDPITSSVAGSRTSMDPDTPSDVQAPSMNSS